jgi:hypothetical protein
MLDVRKGARPMTVATTTTFVYLVEGEPYVGDINDYAKALEQAQYSGIEVHNHVWTFDGEYAGGARGRPVSHIVRTKTTDYDENDYAYMTVSIEFACDDPEEATVRIDGRA